MKTNCRDWSAELHSMTRGLMLLLSLALTGCFDSVPETLTAVHHAHLRGVDSEREVALPHYRPCRRSRWRNPIRRDQSA